MRLNVGVRSKTELTLIMYDDSNESRVIDGAVLSTIQATMRGEVISAYSL